MEQENTQPAAAPKKSGAAKVVSGIHSREIQAGQTVGDIRKAYSKLFNIPEGAVAHSGTKELSDSDEVTENMTIEFVKKSGEKG